MLKGLVCRNYRTLEEFKLSLSPMTTIVGSNGAGKSSALEALSFLLGERWPTLGQLEIPSDFTQLDNSRAMLIQAWFDEPLTYEDAMSVTHEVGVIEFGCQPYKRATGNKLPGDLRDYCRPLSREGKEIIVCTRGPQKNTKPTYAPLTTLNTGLRDQARVLAITQNRSINSHLPGRRGSIMSRLLQEARSSFLKDAQGERTAFGFQYGAAVDALRTDELRAVEDGIADTAKRMLGFKGARASAGLKVQFGFMDPGHPHTALRLLCEQDGLLLPAEYLGAGEQSALVVGLFETFRQRGISSSTILIEEPEMYLYPQAQRYFKQILLDIVEQQNAQVIITTHSPIFADISRFKDLRLLRRVEGEVSPHVSAVTSSTDRSYLAEQLDREKLAQYVDARNSELFFARAVLLVEGHGDRLACLNVAGRLDFDLDAEGLSIVGCGGKSAIPFFARLCRALEIPFLILHDSDIYEGENLQPWMVSENRSAPAKNSAIRTAAGEDVEIYVNEPTLEVALGVGRSATDKPRKVLDAISLLSDDQVPQPIMNAVRGLAQLGSVDDSTSHSDSASTPHTA